MLITEQLDHPDIAPWLLSSLGVRDDAWSSAQATERARLAGLPPVVRTTAAIPHSRLGVNKVHGADGGAREPPSECPMM